jgi:predicted amidohydrolase
VEGPAFTVQVVNGLKVGLLNCYEAEFPELKRRLARLSDGRLTDRPYPEISRPLLPDHAMENSCFVAYANRCGEETVNGQAMAGYPGNSVICGPQGIWWRRPGPNPRSCWRIVSLRSTARPIRWAPAV